MSNLSEEEIIKNLNNVLEKWQEIIKIEDKKEREIEMSMYFEEMPFYEIQGLLDLYNKEKEKNTELEEFNEHIKIFREENLSSEIDYVIALKSNFMGYLKTDYISKDKIREKMKEKMNKGCITATERHLQNYAYDRLKELLEEE